MSNLLKKASILTTPTAYGSGVVNSIIPNTADGDFQFSRNSFATRVNENGLIETTGFFGSNKVSTIINDNPLPFNTFTDNGGGSYTCISTNTTFAGFEQPSLEAFAVSVGQVYRVSFDYTLNSGSHFNFFIGDQAVGSSFSGSSIRVSATGSYSFDLTITADNSAAMFVSQTNQIVNFTISNISVKEVIQSDIPRIDYTNGCGELLLEPQSTNLVPYSSDFNSGWTQYGSPTINTSISPDGTLNGSNITRGSNATPLRYQSLTSTGTQYTFSLYAKKGSVDKIYLDIGDVAEVEFTLTDEWQRFEITQTPPTFTHIDISFGTSTSGDNFYIFGAQLEALTFATSYIPTSGSTVTRAAEALNNAGNSDLINSTEGVLYVEIAALVDSTSGGIRRLSLSDGTNDNRIQILFTNTVGKISVVVKSGGLFQIDTGFSGYNTTDLNKIAIRYGSGVFKVYINGLSVFNDAGVSFSSISLDDLRFSNPSGSELMFARCKSVAVFKEALSDTELASLTTI